MGIDEIDRLESEHKILNKQKEEWENLEKDINCFDKEFVISHKEKVIKRMREINIIINELRKDN